MRNLYNEPIKCLIVQTKFSVYSFWNYQDVCNLLGAKYPAAPLGLLTIAAILPQHWTFRLIDENVEQLLDEHIQWADLVCTGGMLPQQKSILDFIERAHKLNRLVVVGGADPTSQPDLYNKADFLVLGEGEVTIPMFLLDLQNGATKGIYKSEEKTEMINAFVPRFDLIRFGNYLMVGLQFIRGCPFNCEFCDVIELFGRRPRYKKTDQVIKEMQYLYELGYRGHIDFVDDNFVGNIKKVKELLREIKKWSSKHKYPFFFSTEATINLADDDELLQLMKDVDFRYVFLGIETPENETLILSQKNQNVNKSVKDVVLKIMSYGIVCNGGFIIGFDSDSMNIANNMISCIQDSGICMAMIGKLYALPNTQLTGRLESEGRLFENKSKTFNVNDIDQSTTGLNFVTKVPRIEIMKNFVNVIENIFAPENYFKRAIYSGLLIKPDYKYKPSFKTKIKSILALFKLINIIGFNKQTGFLYWKMFFTVLLRNPKGLETAINLAAMFIHFQKQKVFVVSVTNEIIKEIEKVGEDEYNKMRVRHLSVELSK